MLYRKIRHHSSRYVVPVPPGTALVDPKSSGPGFFSVSQSLAERTGSRMLSGVPRSVCTCLIQVRQGGPLQRMDKSAGEQIVSEVSFCVIICIILSRLLISATTGISKVVVL